MIGRLVDSFLKQLINCCIYRFHSRLQIRLIAYWIKRVEYRLCSSCMVAVYHYLKQMNCVNSQRYTPGMLMEEASKITVRVPSSSADHEERKDQVKKCSRP